MGLGSLVLCVLAYAVYAVSNHVDYDATLATSRVSTAAACYTWELEPLPVTVVRGLCEHGLVQGGRACASHLPELNYHDLYKLIQSNMVDNVDSYQQVERKFGEYNTGCHDVSIGNGELFLCRYDLGVKDLLFYAYFDHLTGLVASATARYWGCCC